MSKERDRREENDVADEEEAKGEEGDFVQENLSHACEREREEVVKPQEET